MFGKKKDKVDFEATRTFMGGDFQYDENRRLIRIKNGFQVNIIPVDNIQTYSLMYGDKTYTKANLGKAVVGGALFGILGIAAAGARKEEYISNMKIMIKANDKFYYLILTIGKMKLNAAKGILKTAEDIIVLLDDITG